MNLGITHTSVMLIDAEFLNVSIRENLDFYSRRDPERAFSNIRLGELLLQFAASARAGERDNGMDVIFSCTLAESTLFFTEPADLLLAFGMSEARMDTGIGPFHIRSFFAAGEESCSRHVVNIFRRVIDHPGVERFILVADNPVLDEALASLSPENLKSLFFLKKYRDTTITAPIPYVSIDYPIAFALGLKRDEL